MTEVLFHWYDVQMNDLLCEYDEGQRNRTSCLYGVKLRNENLLGCGAGSKNGALSVQDAGYWSKVLVRYGVGHRNEDQSPFDVHPGNKALTVCGIKEKCKALHL